MDSVELFTGCGGLAFGLSQAGFRSLRMSEWDKHSVANIAHNQKLGLKPIVEWPVHQEDVRAVDWKIYKNIALVAGGPPCQPFSIGGRHRGKSDDRDMWPEAIRAVREIEPKSFLFENVRGLMRPAFKYYLDLILLSLANPKIERGEKESISQFRDRLEKANRSSLYKICIVPVNAADYGAAQKRHRVFIMGLHREVGCFPEAPKKEFTLERLLWDKWVTGIYWQRFGLRKPTAIPQNEKLLVDKLLKTSLIEPSTKPWRTVRDAITGLGQPNSDKIFANHILQEGARIYPGHTGSELDQPAKALKAGVHGVPGGENMINFGNGKVRYFTVREAARLQGLPDKFEFVGSWSENMRQLGNAVPSSLAETFARKILTLLGAPRKKLRAA